MRVKTYPMPKQGAGVNADGRLAGAMHAYLTGIQEVSGRVSEPIEALAPAATLADVIAKINELIAAMQAADQMHPEA